MTKKDKNITSLVKTFKSFPQIKLVYLFGSKAQDNSGPLSDYDFAFYIDENNKKKITDLKLKLIDIISRILKTDNIDVVMLNTVEQPELKYNIIKDGKLILEREPFKVLIEPRILNEYFDFRQMLLKYNLTKP
ncbi:nucleotidyltransferase domain-containing protein [Patescibacteria group bacterium AH-259-L05]|nr:nucleotidyltransferase domain-containing protein [Patescibacteria group bacterium AH-259-L05]